MEEVKAMIDKRLIKLKDDIILYLNPDYYKAAMQSTRIQSFNASIADFTYKLPQDLALLPKVKYLEDQLTDLILGLDDKMSRAKFRVSAQFESAIKRGWEEIKVVLNSFQTDLSTFLYEESLITDVSYEDVVLTRDQVALFITYLRQSKMITKNISDQKVSSHFHDLTGFSAIQISHKIAGDAKYERNLITDLEINYNKLQDLLRSIIILIEDDKRKAILKKAN